MDDATQFQTKPESINIIEEKLLVKKQTVETGKVLIKKQVHEEEKTIYTPALYEEVSIEKVPINQYVEAVPAIRYEGDIMIIPVVKEVIITEKKLMLVEEVHVTKLTHTTNKQQNITLRKEEITIERITPAE